MPIIGFCGNIGCGKSTAANYLINNYNFIEKSFADPLKKICQILFVLSDEQLYGSQLDKETPDKRWFDCSPRVMMQFIGTDLFRKQLNKIMPELKEDIFIHHFYLWYQSQNKNTNIVISDVRFQNEIDIIKKLGGIVVKIEGRRYSSDNHESEIQNVVNYDLLINNSDSLENFYKQIDNIVFLLDKKNISGL